MSFGPAAPLRRTRADRPGTEPIEPMGTRFAAFLPLVVMSGAAAIRVAVGYANGEPMDPTMSFLGALFVLCAVGFVEELAGAVRGAG